MIGLETIEVATRLGYPLSEEDLQVAFQNAEYARTHTTSMLQDIRKGKVTEADELVGYLTEKAEVHKISINALQTVYLLLKNKENAI